MFLCTHAKNIFAHRTESRCPNLWGESNTQTQIFAPQILFWQKDIRTYFIFTQNPQKHTEFAPLLLVRGTYFVFTQRHGMTQNNRLYVFTRIYTEHLTRKDAKGRGDLWAHRTESRCPNLWGESKTRKDTDFFDRRTEGHIFVAETLRYFAPLRETTTLRKAFV